MITGINRLQRTGRSYLHGVLRDAARPFAYRSGARRLLRAEGAAGLRPVYGNHFMPVAFRYLDTPYGYEYGLSDAPRFTPAQPVQALAGEPHVPPPRRDDRPATAPRDARPVTAAPAGKPEPHMPERAPQPPRAADTAAAGAQAAPAIDIRIPGADTRGTASHIEARARTPASRQDPAVPPPPSVLKAQSKSAAQQPETAERSRPEAWPADPATPLPQRLPGNLSLKGLAEMLERQNFEKPAAAQGEARGPDPDARRPSRFPLAAAEPRPDAATGASIATRVLLPETRIASVKPAVAAAAVEPRRMPPAAKVSARRPELRMPAPRRTAPEERRTQQAAPRPDREPRKAGIARVPARATGHRQARSSRRVNVIRRNAPAAFWERSYLSSLELRLYR